MKELIQLFNYNNTEVRSLQKDSDGSVWFIAVDVCNYLEIKNTSQALTKLKDNQKGIILNDTLGGKQELSIISESGLYKLVMKSRKKEAEKFQDWIAEEVIPQIRKTGSYNSKKQNSFQIPESLPEALRLYANEVEAKENAFKEKHIAERAREVAEQQALLLKANNEILEPKAALLDAFHDVTELKTLRQLGYKLKRYGLGPNKIFEFLRQEKIITKVSGENYPMGDNDKYFKIQMVYKKWKDKNTGEIKSSVHDVLTVLPAFYNLLGTLCIKKGYLQLRDWSQIDFNNVPDDSQIRDEAA